MRLYEQLPASERDLAGLGETTRWPGAVFWMIVLPR